MALENSLLLSFSSQPTNPSSKFRYHKFGRQLQRLAGLMKRREFCTIQQSDEREDIHYRFKHTGMWLCETQRGCSKPEARWQPHCRVNEHGGSRSLLDRCANFLSLLTDAFRFWFHKHFSEAEYSHWQNQTHFREILQVFHWFIRPQQAAG